MGGEQKHRLTNVDREARTGVCPTCGPVSVKLRGPRGAACLTRIRAEKARQRAFGGSEMRARLAERYGISFQDYVALLSESDGLCEICRNPFAEREPCLDHDHATGEIRGLLCRPCNLGLGSFRDSPENLRSAAAYLSR